MIGHEGVRRLIEAHLAALLPAKLDEIRAKVPPVEVEHQPDAWPPNPTVMCSDAIPDRSDRLPAVLIGSSQLLSLRASEGGAAPEWHGRYQLDINIVVVSPQAGGDVLAGVGRDRLALAVREVLIQHPDTGYGVVLLTRDLVEETGPAREDAASRPLAAAVLTVQADTVETLDEHAIPIDELTIDISAVDARQNLT